MKILLSRGRHVYLKTYKQKKNSVDEISDASRDFLGIFNRLLSCKGPEHQRLFLQLNSTSRNGLQFISIKGEHEHFTFTHGFFPAEAIENHG